LEQGKKACILDGDNIRHGLCRDLAFSPEDRSENIRRIAEVAKLMNDAGLIVITAFISPFRVDRQQARDIVGEERFQEIHINTPLEVCEQRDVKGLYKKARAGQIKEFTGITSAYEPPENAALTINTQNATPEAAASKILNMLG
jgi:adenylyl-sulfate kinase